MAKAKAGKSKKAVRKVAPRRQAARKQAPEQVTQQPAKVVQTFPCNVLVHKGEEKLPVTVTDEAHYQRLVGEHGDGNVQVQS